VTDVPVWEVTVEPITNEVLVESAPVLIELPSRGLQGPPGPPGPQGLPGGGYTHTQGTPSAVWVVDHPLATYPNVTVLDSAGSSVEGEIVYDSASSITLTFTSAFSGVAYLS